MMCYCGSDVSRYDSRHLPVVKWQTTPERILDDHNHCLSTITRLRLSSMPCFSSRKNYFKNITFLALYNLNIALVEWIITYINCSRITELVIILSNKQPKAINTLLKHMSNIRPLKIDFDQLILDQGVSIEKTTHLKRLDLSNEPHPFREKDIATIAQFFPCLEHLVINTVDLHNIPLMKIYLPKLRSLSFRVNNFVQLFDSHPFQHSIPFVFQPESNLIKIWVDQTTFDKVFWQTSNNSSA
ncbi:unnamed protein product [Adineta steineri]|uniref:Uncharacterized protein n=1 Tax=Adineta steineri TaxID=433720 RepID=A0A815C375_9BILA|nr:unnamed protein product [Adineta steineri]CAF1281629.1 unnamed protein product [Adineta steineri]